ncbi:MAG: LuxR family transcriptional regulator [Hyphomicrobiales bacterium]|nr:LuxR family transcriptional regulator [Hyphomicrobiales bacterium]
MTAVETAWDALELLEILKSPSRVFDARNAILKFCSRYGISNILGGYMPRAGSSADEQLAGVFCSHWPEEWGQHYFSNGYVFSDPTIRRITESALPFSWRSIVETRDLESRSQKVMIEAGEVGLKSGITIPLLAPNRSRAGFSFAGEELKICGETLGILSIVAHSAFQHMSLPIDEPVCEEPVRDEVKLTQRQVDVLSWAAEGKTDWEISSILGVSHHTVDKHMRVIREKLQVTSKAQAVAVAVKRNLIRT